MNRKTLVISLAAAALAVTATPAPATMIASTSTYKSYEDGSGSYAMTFRYTSPVTALRVFTSEFGETPTRLVCRPLVCVASYAPTVLDGSATIRISVRRAGRTWIATAKGSYCLGRGYDCVTV